MRTVRLAAQDDLAGWRDAARGLALARIPPGDVVWRVSGSEGDLFAEDAPPPAPDATKAALSVPRGFIDLAGQAICHGDPERFGMLYRLLFRLQEEPRLLTVAADADVHRAEAMAKAVRRDLHKMTAFVRFREVVDAEGREAYVAWFEPEHHILVRVSSFFVKRFSAMRWSILTPSGCLHWDGASLHRTAGARKADAPGGDAMEAYWRTYYANIFNPARLKIHAMKAEMPVKYWRNLPEAELIAPLIAGAARRAQGMVETLPTAPPVRHLRQAERSASPSPAPDAAIASWEEARLSARGCTRCALHCDATQTVFGEGPGDAPVMFVGEQPGDREDLAGRPFVGPAGQLFDRCLSDARLDRSRAYVTNAVKHFKFQLRGKRRIHQKPNAGEIQACRFWLGLERQFVQPALVVALGATALHALTGHTGSLASMRGRPLALEDGTPLLATVHPSYPLRLPDEAARAYETERFVADLRSVGALAPALLVAAD